MSRGDAKMFVVAAARARLNRCTAVFLLAISPAIGLAQAAGSPAAVQQPQSSATPTPASQTPAAQPASEAATPAADTAPPAAPAAGKKANAEKLPRAGDRRHAAKLFMEATKLFQKEQFEQAMDDFQRASTLDPTNRDYALAADVARSHAVTALIQDSASVSAPHLKRRSRLIRATSR
jgi:tetratricopeptide (TPR) repeat protein